MTDWDVIVIGAGHNSLVCATRLARSGKRVLMIEAADNVGGGAATRELATGFRVSDCAQWLRYLPEDIGAEMSLPEHGLAMAAQNLATVSLGRSGDHIILRDGTVEGDGISAHEQAQYKAFSEQMQRYAALLASLYRRAPPKIVSGDWRDRFAVARLALKLKLLGREEMRDFMRIILINIYDVLEERFAHPGLKGLLASEAMWGSFLGPRSPNTVFGFLHNSIGPALCSSGVSQVAGGMGSLSEAMAASATRAGVQIRCGVAVQSIDVREGVARGVTLQNGEALEAALVVSGADPATTLEKLLGYRHLETADARRVDQIRYKSGAAKLHLALNGLPQFTGLDEKWLGHRLIIAPDMDYCERAFNAVKYAEYSAEPIMDISVASVNDQSLAPAGQHVLSATVQYVPHTHRDGWPAQHEALLSSLITQLERYAPGIGQQVLTSELLTPADLEARYGMRGGHWHHGELSLDQVLMMRPFPGADRYAMPLPGLYLCGAGTHPGGGVMGVAGHNAAQAILTGVGQS